MTRTIAHRGGRLAYEVSGSGPVVLFIQGVGVHGSGWQPQIEALADRYTCIAFDNPGLGGSIPVPATITVGDIGDAACAILDAEGAAAVQVVGHSLGGAVALTLALRHRQRVRSLALLCTFASGKSAAPLTGRMMWWGMRSRLGTRRMRRRGFLGLVHAPGALAGADLEALADRIGTLFGHDLADQPAVVPKQLRAMRAFDMIDELSALAGLPTLVVGATHDPIAPPALGRALAAGIPGARFVEAAGASHGLPITHAAWVNELLVEHLAASAS
ncbi:MAG: alpha/beta fold hydrolase [Vicinamibacterales bacterium]